RYPTPTPVLGEECGSEFFPRHHRCRVRQEYGGHPLPGLGIRTRIARCLSSFLSGSARHVLRSGGRVPSCGPRSQCSLERSAVPPARSAAMPVAPGIFVLFLWTCESLESGVWVSVAEKAADALFECCVFLLQAVALLQEVEHQ